MPTPAKTIVLTGATKGLGRAMTAEFARLGHRVLGCGRSPGAIDELVRDFPPPHDFQTLDVASMSAVDLWAARLINEFGPPDLLINNAALINENGKLWDIPPETFDRVIDVNIKGVYYSIRAFAPAMIQRGQGVIVNLSSGWGKSTAPYVAPYCASKYAIEGLTLALAAEMPAGMAAVPFSPGIIHTKMLESCFGPDAHNFPEPDDWVKRAVPYLLSIGPSHNGQSLEMPG